MFFIHVVFLIYYYFHARKVEYGSDLDNFKFKKELQYFHSGKPEENYACIYINGKSLTTSHIHITIYASSKIDNMYYLGRKGVGLEILSEQLQTISWTRLKWKLKLHL